MLTALFKRGEVKKKQIRRTATQLGRDHGLVKIHKGYNDVPKFRPIIGTTNSP